MNEQTNETDLADVLDLDTLTQYKQAIGAEALLSSVDLFEQLYPEYLGLIEQALERQDNDVITSEAHKLKGATGSVGLLRLCKLAQKVQVSSTEDWDTQHPVWIAEIRERVSGDIALLKDWLSQG